MELSILISSLLANLITKFLKNEKTIYMSDSELESRKTFLRVMNAVAGIAIMLLTTALIGGEIDTAQLSSLVEIVVAGAVTYATSQGLFHLSK